MNCPRCPSTSTLEHKQESPLKTYYTCSDCGKSWEEVPEAPERKTGTGVGFMLAASLVMSADPEMIDGVPVKHTISRTEKAYREAMHRRFQPR